MEREKREQQEREALEIERKAEFARWVRERQEWEKHERERIEREKKAELERLERMKRDRQKQEKESGKSDLISKKSERQSFNDGLRYKRSGRNKN